MENWVPPVDDSPLDEDEGFVEETQKEEHVQQTTSTKRKRQAKGKQAKGKKGKGKGNSWSKAWDTFERVKIKDDDGVEWQYGECNWCKKLIKADTTFNGTSGLKRHNERCQLNPENIKNQSTLQFKKNPDGKSGEGSVSIWKHDEQRINKALLNLFVVGELPFKFVENEAFVEYTNACNGKVVLPCRHTISNRIANYYVEEMTKLASYLSSPLIAVHLTTDTWTSSCQRTRYMVVTAHFVDEIWSQHKRIISFRPIDTSKGEDIGREVLECIYRWGIKNVMTITVDNATSNDKAMEFLIERIPNMYDNGKHFQVRCMAHILNLIVKDGLDNQGYHVLCLQKAVRYIRLSTQRIVKFKRCMKEVGVESNRFLCNDCPTRWNSTYEMLKSACALEPVFYKYVVADPSFGRDFRRPTTDDFRVCREVMGFLEKFKKKTELVSSSSIPLAHRFIREILDVDKHIRDWSVRPEFCLLGKDMRDKYDKYWGDFEKLNDYMFFALLLDPEMKLNFLKHVFSVMVSYTEEDKDLVDMKAKSLVGAVEKKMENLFMVYKQKYDDVESNVSSQERTTQDVPCVDDENDFFFII